MAWTQLLDKRPVLGWLAWCLLCVSSGRGLAGTYTPDSAEVRALLDGGKRYLASTTDSRVGGKALAALVFVKEGEASHPRVSEALEAALAYVGRGKSQLVNENNVYDICLCTLFLCELDAVKHRPSIDMFLSALWERQQAGGGFGYAGGATGDTSMTQYVVLAAWTAHQHDVAIDWDALEKALEWLIRTQTPEGAWGYQANDPSRLGARVQQSEVRLSLAAGGLGSVYICVDLLGAGRKLGSVSATESKLPAAFRRIEESATSAEDTAKPARSLNPSLLTYIRRSTNDGNDYFKSHFKIPNGKYDHYFLYALERYESFRQQIDKTPGPNPLWYDQGVEWLTSTQESHGGWGGECQQTADTAFACLFLMRSTEQSIQASLGKGLLTGGRGLPKDTSHVRISRGKIVAQPLTASPEEIFSIMEDPDHPDFAALTDNPESVLLSGNAAERGGQLQRLRRLVQTGNTESRRLAVQALARQRDFDNIPVLIFALGDKDYLVVREARDALRFISRRFDGFGMPDFPSPEQQAAGIEAWKNWYRSVRPNARFLE